MRKTEKPNGPTKTAQTKFNFSVFFWVKFGFGLNFKKLKFINSVLILVKIISNQTETDRYISL